MWVQEKKLSDLYVVQLIRDFTTNHAWDAREFFLDINFTWHYQELINHLSTFFFKSSKAFSLLIGSFYSQIQHGKVTDDHFADKSVIEPESD